MRSLNFRLRPRNTTAPPTYRLKETTKDINSSVICKLTRVCRLPWLVEEIKKVCVVMKQVQLEGWHLANLHVLCCLKEGDDEVPELTQMFFYRCCAATLGNIEKRDRPKDQTQYKSFHETCQRYWANRERETAYTSESMLNPESDQRDGEADGDQRAQHDRPPLPPSAASVHPIPVRKELQGNQKAGGQLLPRQVRARAGRRRHATQRARRRRSKTVHAAAGASRSRRRISWVHAPRPARIIHITEVEDFLKNELDIVPTKKKTLGAQRPFRSRPSRRTELKYCGRGGLLRQGLVQARAEYSPDVLIGIDPGMRSLYAVSIGHLPSRRQKSQRGKHCRRRGGGRRKELVTEISTSEYRHLARMNDYRFYHENLKKREPWYAGVIRAMPSVETSSYDVYLQRLEFFWKHLRFLLAFGSEQAFLRWRFTQDRAKMKALDTLAQRLVPKASKQVCIAYGDWSRRDKIKGHATGPVKGLGLTKVKRKEDETDIRLKSQPSKKEAKEIAEMAKFRNPKLADKMIVLKYTRNVLRCTNSSCKANFWSRDVNAARNMLELLSSGLKGKHGARRLRAFRRSK
ncbi:hypothetical protein GQ600_12009 [Phytophthora cactorum]|nr:hypothetical protein GQ600_12009 [Phytophthora cactorum]